MNTRQDHLQRELAGVEQAIETTRSLLNKRNWDAKERAHLQAQVDVLERRARTLQQLIGSYA